MANRISKNMPTETVPHVRVMLLFMQFELLVYFRCKQK